MVRLQPGAGFSADVLDQLGGEVLHRFEFPTANLMKGGEMLHLQLPKGTTTAEAMAALEHDPRVTYAAPNDIIHVDQGLAGKTSVPNDLDKKLWGLQAIQSPAAWETTRGSRNGPVIAVLDTGCDVNHPDLRDNLWTNPKEIPGNGLDDDGNGVVDDVHGFFPKENNGNLTDKLGHGSHTAGTIGAVGNNGQGITGINWEAQIMPIKIFDSQGQTDVALIARGLEYAARHGARITSNSWGGTEPNPALEDAFKSCPALHIAACGNSGLDTDIVPHYPSSIPLANMISVAASDRRDRLASFSNFGAESVDLAAPGVDIYSTFPKGRYKTQSGTSMACPHVSGVAALIATAYPEASHEEIRSRLLEGVDLSPSLRGKVASGGRLNAAKALAPR